MENPLQPTSQPTSAFTLTAIPAFTALPTVTTGQNSGPSYSGTLLVLAAAMVIAAVIILILFLTRKRLPK
jgi:hypothetical protein